MDITKIPLQEINIDLINSLRLAKQYSAADNLLKRFRENNNKQKLQDKKNMCEISNKKGFFKRHKKNMNHDFLCIDCKQDYTGHVMRKRCNVCAKSYKKIAYKKYR